MVIPMGSPPKADKTKRKLEAVDGNVIYVTDYLWATKFSPKRNDDCYLHALEVVGWQNHQAYLKAHYEEKYQKVAQGLQKLAQGKEETPQNPGSPPTAG